MASEIEKLLTSQETTTSQVELFNENKETFEDLLLEQMITNEELLNSASRSEASFSDINDTLVDLPLKLASSLKGLMPSEDVEEPFGNPQLAEIAEIMKQGFSEVLSMPASEASEMVEINRDAKLLPPPETDENGENLPIVVNAPENDNPMELAELSEYSLSSSEYLKNIDDNIQLMAQAATAEEEVLGKATDFGEDSASSPNDDSGGLDGFGGLFTGLGQKFGKFGKLAKGALKIGGSVLAAGMVLSDVYEGFTNDERIMEISGKAKQDLSNAEESAVAIGNVVEGLSFGLINAKDVFNESVGLMDTLQGGLDQLFDPEQGAFGTLTNSLFQGIDNISDGNYEDAIGTIVDGFAEAPGRLLDVLGGWTSSLVEMLPGEVSDNIKKRFGDVKDFAGSIFDSASSFLGFGDDEPVLEQPTSREQNNSFMNRVTEEPVQSVNPSVNQPVNSPLNFSEAPEVQRSSNINRPVDIQPVTQSVSSPRSVSALGNEGLKTIAISKKRFEEKSQTSTDKNGDTTVVVNQQNSEKKRIDRSTSNSDMKLAFLNAGMAD
jgi:hypothetical protein